MELQPTLLETAKLAREKGFDWKVKLYYSNPFKYKPELRKDNKTDYLNWNSMDDFPWKFYSAPTQPLLQKWLRIVHKIDITVCLYGDGYGYYIHINRLPTNHGQSRGVWETFSEALEAALIESLTEYVKNE